MKIKSVIFLLFLYSITSCDVGFVNKKTSEIGSTCVHCLDIYTWNKIVQKYSPKKISDTVFLIGLKQIKEYSLLWIMMILFILMNILKK